MQNPGTATADAAAALSPRDRAIQAFQASDQAQKTAVLNPSRVSVEELSAIKSPTKPSNNGQPTTSEAQTTAAPDETKPAVVEEPLSSQYAALARKERAARAQAQARDAEFKAKEAAFKIEQEAFKARELEYQSKYVAKDSFQADPLKALTDAGMSYDQITEMLLNQQAQPTNPVYDNKLAQLNAKIAELEAKTASASKLIEDRDVQARQQAVSQIAADVNKLVFTDPAYETIKNNNQGKEVVRLIEETFDKEGILMTVEEAAQAVEDELVEQIYLAASKSSKVQKRLQPVSALLAQKQSAPSSNNQLKTLTNSVSSNRQLSARERAILAFKGEKY
jgi:hypothetical protein